MTGRSVLWRHRLRLSGGRGLSCAARLLAPPRPVDARAPNATGCAGCRDAGIPSELAGGLSEGRRSLPCQWQQQHHRGPAAAAAAGPPLWRVARFSTAERVLVRTAVRYGTGGPLTRARARAAPGFCSFAQLGTLLRHACEGSLLAGENWRGVGWVGVGRTISLYWISLWFSSFASNFPV